jgi:Tol biopolymer transport system component
VFPLAANLSAKGEPRRLTKDNRVVSGIAWTADGHEIIVASGPFGAAGGLWRVAVSGSADPGRLSIGENGFYPSISRQGNRLIYSQRINDANIWRVNLSDPLSPPTQLIASTRFESGAQYSPDGKKIAFNSNRTGNSEIWVCDADGSNPVQIVSIGLSLSPRWSPDGQRIAFDSNVTGNWQIYTVSANGGRPQRITNSAANEPRASWSHDGNWIYFGSNRLGGSPQFQIWKAPAAGGEAVQVTKRGGFNAFESKDGKTVYYTKSDLSPSPLWKVPVGGGDETQVLDSVANWAFAPTSGGLYFISQSRLQYFDFSTGRSKPILTLEKPVSNFLSVSPDERWLLYTQTDQDGSDLMLVENFK